MTEHILNSCTKIPAASKSVFRASIAPKRSASKQIPDSQVARKSISSPPAKRSHLPIGRFFDSMSPEELEKSQELLVRSLITGGVPLNFLANEDFKSFLAAIRPKFVLPNRQRSQKQIVTNIYEKEKLVVDRSIKNATNVAISTDGWKDINKHHMMNFVVHTPTEWLHSFQPETSGEASFISNKIVELVEEIGSEKVTSADKLVFLKYNLAMKRSFERKREKYSLQVEDDEDENEEPPGESIDEENSAPEYSFDEEELEDTDLEEVESDIEQSQSRLSNQDVDHFSSSEEENDNIIENNNEVVVLE
uniref:DUF659 domain-containing protein n=1 Tax=Panagrolaimus davidi TaxID=227884 RepID=A0A914QDC1_9BILA